MARRITFTEDYNHRWPSRAVSFFRSGRTYTVKAEVRDAALAKGKATDAVEPVSRLRDGKTARHTSPGRVDGRSDDADRRRARRTERRSDVGAGLGNAVPIIPVADE